MAYKAKALICNTFEVEMAVNCNIPILEAMIWKQKYRDL